MTLVVAMLKVLRKLFYHSAIIAVSFSLYVVVSPLHKEA